MIGKKGYMITIISDNFNIDILLCQTKVKYISICIQSKKKLFIDQS